MTYSEIKKEWNTSHGFAVRALLHLKKDSGAWLWYKEAFESLDKQGCISFTSGDVAYRMLNIKIEEATNWTN